MITEISIYRIEGKWHTRIIDGEARAELALSQFYIITAPSYSEVFSNDLIEAVQEVGLAYEVEIDESEIVVDEDGRTATWKRKEKAMTIEGVPEGWELVRIGILQKGDWFVNMIGAAEEWVKKTDSAYFYPIIRKIEKPKKFRQFANAEEFKPHRDRWFTLKHNPDWVHRVCRYNNNGIDGASWGKMFDDAEFRDGSPFGVEVTE